SARRQALDDAARARSARWPERQLAVRREVQRGEPRRGADAGESGRRLRLALLLLLDRGASSRSGAGIRRRREEDGTVRAEEGAGGDFPWALGAERAHVLHGREFSSAIQERRVHRVPRVVEPRTGAPSGIQRGVPAAGGGKI